MEKKPITSNLFRFVTLRSPQLADERKKEQLFVSYKEAEDPTKEPSLAHKSVAGLKPEQEKERIAALSKAYTSKNFKPILNRHEFRKSHGKLYDFSNWLMRNKNYLTAKNTMKNIAVFLYDKKVDPKSITTIEKDMILKEAEEVVLWNNLFYQTIHKTSTPVREGLIQMLIANRFLIAFNQFIKAQAQGTPTTPTEGGVRQVVKKPVTNPSEITIEFTEDQKKEFLYRANASVIIPKKVLYSLTVENAGSDTKKPTANQSEYLEKAVVVDQAKARLETYETALKEIERAELVYNKEEDKKYQEALKVYDQKVAEIKKKPPVIETVVDPKTKVESKIKTYPGLENVSIVYTKANEIIRIPKGAAAKLSPSEAKITAQLSTETKNLINSTEFQIYDTFVEVKTVLEDKVKKEKEAILDNTSQRPYNLKMVYVGYLDDNANDGVSLRLSFYLDKPEKIRVLDAQYDFVESTNKDKFFLGRSFENLPSSTNTRIDVKLFTEKIKPNTTTYKFGGELALSNGQILVFNNESLITIGKDKNGYFTASGLEGKFKLTGTSDSSNSGGASNSTNTTLNKEVIYGVTQLGIADFRRVEQEVCCYVPGEVSHIENVMAREYKERRTRNLTSYQSTTEQSFEREAEVLTDTTSTERNELRSEASSIVNKDSSTSFGANASVNGDFLGVNYSAGTDYSTNNSSSVSNSNSQAQTYAQEVTERALERVVEKVSRKRTTRMLKEHEENTTHGFDNRKGTEHVTGIYRWLDIIYKNKLVNYGKRLMYEFAIPEPAKFYIDDYLNKGNDSTKDEQGLIAPEKPKHPRELFSLFSAKDLTDTNYQRIASRYNADVKPPLDPKIKIGKSFKKEDRSYDANGYSFNDIEVPRGYFAKGGAVNWDGYVKSVNNFSITFLLGRTRKRIVGGRAGVVFLNFTERFKEKIPFSFVSQDVLVNSTNVSIYCERSDEYFQKWQNETFKAIINAYNKRVQEYNEFIKGQKITPEEKKKKREFSSKLNRGIEKREIKRIAIDLMTAPFSKKFTVSKNHYKNNSTTVTKSKELDNHAAVVKFFEQAFDWEIMAYTFYPYFYKEESKWEENFDFIDTNDPIFKAFLQSGMARTVVPVRPGFEAAVNWFMNTGELWSGQGMVTDTKDDLYVSIAEELSEPTGKVEGEPWETRVPTALTILQADSAVLDEGGLPCNPNCKEHSQFKSGSTTGPKGVDFDIVGKTNVVK